jgi:hypothetical protein
MDLWCEWLSGVGLPGALSEGDNSLLSQTIESPPFSIFIDEIVARVTSWITRATHELPLLSHLACFSLSVLVLAAVRRVETSLP